MAEVDDITARKQAEETLHASEQFHRDILNALDDHIAVLDRQGIIVAVNAAWERFARENGAEHAARTGVGADYLAVCRNATGAFAEEAQAALEGIQAVLQGDRPFFSLEYPCHSPEVRRWFVMHAAPLSHANAGVIVSHTNITERKLAELLLHQSNERLELAKQAAGAGVWDWDIATGAIDWSPELFELFGLDPQKATASFDTWHAILHPLDRHSASQRIDQTIQEHEPQHVSEYRIVWPNGEVRWISALGYTTYGDAGQPLRMTGVCMDTTDRKRSEEALRESEARFRGYFEMGLIGMAITSPEKGILQINDCFCGMLGYSREELMRLSWAEITHPDDLAGDVGQFNRLLAGEIEGYALEKRFRHKSRSLVYTHISVRGIRNAMGGLDHVVAFAQDITQRKRAEEMQRHLESQLLQAQKLESLGVLAGGIAHDFNNILAGIRIFAELVQADLASAPQAFERLAEIQKATQRGAELTRQILTYAGKDAIHAEPLNLSLMVEDMKKMLEIAVSKRAVLQYELAADVANTQADAGQMRQVVMNLVANASDALGDNNGVVSIATSMAEVSDDSPISGVSGHRLPPGPYICLEVADTGCGMNKPTLQRIFDPFFTTKFTGRGLGLATVHGIIRTHQGAIQVSSQPGQGSIFRVFLPATTAAALPVQSEPAKFTRTRASGTVLVVDDEEMVCQGTQALLESVGFQVLIASDGPKAIDAYRLHRVQIVCVILDLTMPKMSGEEVFCELRRIDPDVRIVLTSGYTEAAMMQRFVGQQVFGFVQKPGPLGAIIAKLQRSLAAGG
jgi:two-component system, cell cycle sensor histidine kinase and response regulator CckA